MFKVWIVIREFNIGNKTYYRPIYNKRGNCLEFQDKEHAEYFITNHPEAFYEGDLVSTWEVIRHDEDELELGRIENVWEGIGI